MVSVEVSEEGGQASLSSYGKIQQRNLSSCSYSFFRSPFISCCVFLHIFLRKHNHSQLTRSQGEHDHGNDAGDQSQWRISGKGAGRVFLFAIHRRTPVNSPYPLCAWRTCADPSVFPSEASCPWNVTGYCQSSAKMWKCRSEVLKHTGFMATFKQLTEYSFCALA